MSQTLDTKQSHSADADAEILPSLYFDVQLQSGVVFLPNPPKTLWMKFAAPLCANVIVPAWCWLLTPETLAGVEALHALMMSQHERGKVVYAQFAALEARAQRIYEFATTRRRDMLDAKPPQTVATLHRYESVRQGVWRVFQPVPWWSPFADE